MGDIKETLSKLPDIRTICEIGCCQMEDTAWMRETWPQAVIHCFEPDPRNVGHINENATDEKLNVIFHATALGDVNGQVAFWMSGSRGSPIEKGWSKSSSMMMPKELKTADGDWMIWSDQIMVPCNTLDSFRIPGIDLVWMDVQSAEVKVIAGATNTLPRIHYILTEHNTSGVYCNEPCLDGIKSALRGWECLQVWPYDALFHNPHFKA